MVDMTPSTWLASLRDELPPGTDSDSLIAELRHLLDDGVPLASFGDPKDFARSISTDTDDFDDADDADSSRDWFTPNVDGLKDSPEGRSHWWDPTDSRILIPRSIGIGWDINLGAVAVKLGWLRPDDFDDDVVGAISPNVTRVIETLPIALAGSGVALAALVARADRVPTRISASGQVQKTGNAKVTAALYATGALASAAFAATRKSAADQLITSSVATGVNAAITSSLVETLVAAKRGRGSAWFNLPKSLVLTAPLGMMVWAVKSGLKNVADSDLAHPTTRDPEGSKP